MSAFGTEERREFSKLFRVEKQISANEKISRNFLDTKCCFAKSREKGGKRSCLRNERKYLKKTESLVKCVETNL